MSDWPRYESHKIVQAAVIKAVERDDETDEVQIWVLPEGATEVELFAPTVQAMTIHAEVGGYAIRYHDGFRSIDRKGSFEAGYVRIP